MKNYYEILEVNEKASLEVIERVYKTLAKKYHPDVNPDNPKAAEEKFKEISEAYEVLSDETKRRQYDSKLNAQRQAQQVSSMRASSSSMQSPYRASTTSSSPYSRPSPYGARTTTSSSSSQYSDLERTRKMQEQMAQKAYNDAYIRAMKDMGYNVVYEKPLKERLKSYWLITKVIFTLIIVCVILWHIPFVHDWIMDWYEGSGPFKAFFDEFLSRI